MIRRGARVTCPLGGGRVLWLRYTVNDDGEVQKTVEAVGVRVDRTGLETVYTPEELEPEAVKPKSPKRRTRGGTAMVRRLEVLHARLDEAEDRDVLLFWTDNQSPSAPKVGMVVDRVRMRNAVAAMLDLDASGRGVVTVHRVHAGQRCEIHMQCARVWMKVRGVWGTDVERESINVDFIVPEIVAEDEVSAAVGA